MPNANICNVSLKKIIWIVFSYSFVFSLSLSRFRAHFSVQKKKKQQVLHCCFYLQTCMRDVRETGL